MTRGGLIPVFVGPSLGTERRASLDGFDWRPPAAAGDLAALLDEPPVRLCLIDGLFDTCPAPWHKELLLLMERGTVVFGASSMGALRAAELEPFGMIGVGAIFRAYRSGMLTGDDEVALIHATEKLDWAPLTVPMVEFRATLAAARRSRIIDGPTARRMRELVREIHFSDRDWPLIAKECEAAGLGDAQTVSELKAMHVPLKELDALACLAAARGPLPNLPKPPQPPLTCFIRHLLEERAHP